MERLYIRSVQNPRVKALMRLKESRERRRKGRFLIEGRRELLRAMECGVTVEQFYFAPEYFGDGGGAELVMRASDSGVEAIRLSQSVFGRCSYRKGPDGLLAVGQARSASLDNLPRSGCPLYLVVDGIEKPGNLGALIRTADAAGVDAVLVTDPVADLYNPNVIRASQGSVFGIFVAVGNRNACVEKLRFLDVHVLMASPESRNPYWNADFRQPIALVMGSEKEGLSEFWMVQAGAGIKIPMSGISDSLNVSAAAAIVLFEAVRQRNFGK